MKIPDCSLNHVSGVYRLVNIVTGECYVGSSTNLGNRMAVHRYRMTNGTHGNRNVQAAFDEHGITAFSFEVLMIVADKIQLIAYEQQFIDQLKPAYNLAPKAGSCLGVKFSQQSREKISARVSGEGNYWFGKKLPCAGASSRPEVRAKLSRQRSGEGNPMFGVTPAHAKLTDDQVRAIRASIANGESLRSLAERYGVSKGAVAHIKQGRSYQRVV